MKRNSIATGLKAALLTALAATVPVLAGAKTDVAGKIGQLKENAENSRVNLKQYEENLKTVVSNLEVTDKAVQSLDKQTLALAKQTAESQKGKTGVESSRKQLEGLMHGEQQKLATEQKQIEDLKRALAQAEANAAKRQENVNFYQEKLKKVDKEATTWSERNQSIIELESALHAKTTQAKAEHKRLTEKKAAYEGEIAKWQKQVRISEREYSNFSKVKE